MLIRSFAALALAAIAAQAPAQVAVSIGIAPPGVYGRIDIGTVVVPPVLVYPKPALIAPPPPAVVAPAPIYMWVPPGHARDWAKHCKHYGACGAPVYFVRDDWYRAHYHAAPPNGKGHGKGHGKG